MMTTTKMMITVCLGLVLGFYLPLKIVYLLLQELILHMQVTEA